MPKKYKLKFFIFFSWLFFYLSYFKTQIVPYKYNNYFKSNNFIVNGKVTQYSSILYVKSNSKYIQLETLNYIRDYRSNQLKCLLNDGQSYYLVPISNILSISLMQTKYNVNQLYKISCKLEKQIENLNQLSIALIDKQDFEEKKNQTKYVLFQKPIILKLNDTKKKNIVNCVHSIYNLSSSKKSKLINWLKFMKKTGYDKVVLYFVDNHNDFFKILGQKFGLFIQIYGHNITENEICKWHKQKTELFHQDSQYKSLLDWCLLSMKINLDINDEMTKNTHERLHSNDCLMKNLHEYQYISNYDFDEFIFPRSFYTDHIRNINKTKVCYKNNNKSFIKIYDFIENLEKKYGKKVAYYQFENVNMLGKHEIIRKALLSNNTKFIDYSFSKTHLNFTINNLLDKNLFQSFQQSISLFDCMNKTIYKNTNLDSKWNNYIAASINNRAGKSIYNTDYTLSYNQHFAWTISNGSKKVSIPLSIGYVNHFRDSDLFFNREYSLKNLFLDWEYYNFLWYNEHIFSS